MELADKTGERMQSQFDHIAETYFMAFDFDLGERELGYALAFDHDLEMFAASVGLIKTSVMAVLRDDGMFICSVFSIRVSRSLTDVEVDMGSVDPEADFFGPLQKLLDQCRSAKVLSKFYSS